MKRGNIRFMLSKFTYTLANNQWQIDKLITA